MMGQEKIKKDKQIKFKSGARGDLQNVRGCWVQIINGALKSLAASAIKYFKILIKDSKRI